MFQIKLKRIFNRKSVLGLLLAIILPLLSILPAQAAQPGSDAAFNITSSPLPISLTTTPGKPVTTDLRVQNSGTQTATIKVSLLKFKSSDKTGKPLLIKQDPAKDTYFNWVSFNKTSFTADPGEWNTVTMTIDPPTSAANGYYYAVLFSQDTSKTQVGPKTSKLAGATATLVLLDVQTPGQKRQLEVTSFKSDHKLYEYLPVNFTVSVKNTGNIHLIPAGDIFISRGKNKKTLAVISFNPNAGNVLPNSTRDFEASWKDGFPVFETKRDNGQIVADKKGTPIQQLKYDFSKTDRLRFGKYHAYLLLTYNDGKKDVPIEAEVSFWVVPWKALSVITIFFAVFAFVSFLAFLYVRQLRRDSKRAKAKGKQKE